MKQFLKVALALILIVLIIIVVMLSRARRIAKISTEDTSPIAQQNTQDMEASVEGCYVATLQQDVYSMNIISQEGSDIEGTLVFNNYEKDSSSGSLKGSYEDGILFGRYVFQSEGMNSDMEVIFKKVEDGFIRGYGPVDETGENFISRDDIEFDASFVFEATDAECAEPAPRINLE